MEGSGHSRSPSVSAAQRQGTALVVSPPKTDGVYIHLTVRVCCFQGTVANTASCVQLHKRAERVAVALMERGRLNAGDHVALVYPPGKREGNLYHCALIKGFQLSFGLNFSLSSYFAGIDLIATFYGCLYAGCVPVTVRPPHPQNLTTTLPTVKMIVEVTTAHALLP